MSDEKFYALMWTIGVVAFIICMTIVDIAEGL